jgi:hypothetical protein
MAAFRHTFIVGLALCVSASGAAAGDGAGPARADGADDVVAGVTKLNRKAIAEWENLNFDEARKILDQALAEGAKAGLGRHPVTARTYVNLGVVALTGFKQRDVALDSFAKALAIQPDIRLSRNVANPEVQEVFGEAIAAAPKAASSGSEARARADEPTPSDGAEHRGAPAGHRSPRASASPPRGDVEVGRIWIALLGGSGVGWMTGSGDVNPAHRTDPPGLAWARAFHVTPEVGYFLRPDLLLSLQARIQLVTGVTPEVCPAGTTCGAPPKWALAGLAKATWFLGAGALRPYLSAAAGVGTIRLVAAFPQYPDCPAGTACVDSITAGAVLVGPGAGIVYDLAPRVGLVAGVATELAFPRFTFNVDLNAGVAARF